MSAKPTGSPRSNAHRTHWRGSRTIVPFLPSAELALVHRRVGSCRDVALDEADAVVRSTGTSITATRPPVRCACSARWPARDAIAREFEGLADRGHDCSWLSGPLRPTSFEP